MTRLLALSLISSFAVASTGCFDSDLSRRSEIEQWRTLAIVADPPTTYVDGTVRFSTLSVDPDGQRADLRDDVQLRWTLCVGAERTPGLSGLQYNPESQSEACTDSMTSMLLETQPDGSALLDVSSIASMFNLEDLEAGLEELVEMLAMFLDVPPGVVDTVLDEIGFPIRVGLRVSQGGELRVTAFKRFLLALNGDIVNTNPDPPQLDIDELTYQASADDPFECLPVDGAQASVRAGSEVILDPQDVFLQPEGECPEGHQCWIEDYRVLDITGELITLNESAFYSWYGTDGRMDQERTLSPADEEIWTAPADPGDYPIWMVVRDGHGGTAGCRAMITVTE